MGANLPGYGNGENVCYPAGEKIKDGMNNYALVPVGIKQRYKYINTLSSFSYSRFIPSQRKQLIDDHLFPTLFNFIILFA
jgi:hypothetical protein